MPIAERTQLKTLSDRLKAALAGPPVRTQAALARACGIKPPSVNDWLSGKTRKIEGENLLRAAAFLNVTPTWLATGKGPMRAGEQEQAAASNVSAGPSIKGRSRLSAGCAQETSARQLILLQWGMLTSGCHMPAHIRPALMRCASVAHRWSHAFSQGK